MDDLLTHAAYRIRYLLYGLLARAWKYICMRQSPKTEAPHYVNIAHRAALM